MILHHDFIFNGEAREAITFYAKALRITHGEINTYGYSSMPHEPHQKDWVIHAELLFKDNTLAMFADSADTPLRANPNIHISLNYTDLEEMKVAFERLAEGGKITMPLEKQFWNATYGQLADRFGLHWMMNFNHQQ